MGTSARLIQVIVTDELRGTGTSKDIFRRVTQYWSVDGKLLAEVDPVPNSRMVADSEVTMDEGQR